MVHTPIEAQESLIEEYRGKSDPVTPTYFAMIKNLDNLVGGVIQYLESNELIDDTIIVFSSDNGVEGMYSIRARAEPLRGIKKNLTEGGIRAPLVIRYPRIKMSGKVIEESATQLDLLPTLVHMAGGQIDENTHDGDSLMPLLMGWGDWKERAHFWHFPSYRGPAEFHIQAPVSAIRRGDWKLIQSLEDTDDLELYHLRKDIGESNNVASQNPELASRLRKELENWRRDYEVPMPTR